MAISAQEEKSIQRYIRYIREIINDKKEFNRLLRQEESSDTQIRLALINAISQMSFEDPNGNYGITTCPYPHLLIDLTIVRLLKAAAIWNVRNTLRYNAGGLSVELYGKGAEYSQLFSNLEKTVKAELRDAYIIRNLRSAFAMAPMGISSDYLTSCMSFLEDVDGWTNGG